MEIRFPTSQEIQQSFQQIMNQGVINPLEKISGVTREKFSQLKQENDQLRKRVETLEQSSKIISEFQLKHEAQNQKISDLDQKINRYMTMVPVSGISLSSSNGTHKIPESIPQNATHLLLYCVAQTGSNVGYSDHTVVFSNSLGHKYHFFYKCYNPQNAWSINSDNIWIKICPNREITISGNGGHMSVTILAYK
ncbi:MAG: hypothetical protein P0S93_01495 [Candidatus Neptunochlamydia sp.]|nr:hypothetical protein [Candidatus Neptunochlamydia sp.]